MSIKRIFDKSIIAVNFILLIIMISGCNSTSHVSGTHDSYSIASQILGENRELVVRKPRGYKTGGQEKYPVIYVFGGNSLNYSIYKDLDLLIRTGHCIPAIIVGIPNINQKTRQRDLTPPFLKQDLDDKNSPLGEADKYLAFVKTEIISFIDSNYHVSNDRIAVGHSREGLMVMYSLMFMPDLFNSHLALSPALWREKSLFVEKFSDFVQESDTLPSQIVMTIGDLEVDKMKSAFDKTVQVLENNSSKVNYKKLFFPDANHAQNPFLTAPIGLNWILDKRQ